METNWRNWDGTLKNLDRPLPVDPKFRETIQSIETLVRMGMALPPGLISDALGLSPPKELEPIVTPMPTIYVPKWPVRDSGELVPVPNNDPDFWALLDGCEQEVPDWGRLAIVADYTDEWQDEDWQWWASGLRWAIKWERWPVRFPNTSSDSRTMNIEYFWGWSGDNLSFDISNPRIVSELPKELYGVMKGFPGTHAGDFRTAWWWIVTARRNLMERFV